jgi:hypothetical protein
MLGKEAVIKPGFSPIPIGAKVKIARAYDQTWHLGSTWEVVGYENFRRNNVTIGPITALCVKSWPTERFFCWNKLFAWQVEVLPDAQP